MEDLQIGAWLNVVGYIARASPQTGRADVIKDSGNLPTVQALMMWNAGPLKIGEYETALEARKSAGSTGQMGSGDLVLSKITP
jgi:Telomere capping, CST complex subunit